MFGGKKCVICDVAYLGYGNNPYPITKFGKCCDVCNEEVFIARIRMACDRPYYQPCQNVPYIEDKAENPEPSVQPMQIFVQTLSFGTITLDDVKASENIGDVKKRVRDKLDTLFTGFDVEVTVATENQLIFESKVLDDDLKLSDYNIQKESVLKATSGLSGGVGGVIRKHLKKEDAIKALKARAIAAISEETDAVDDSILGDDMKAFLTRMENNLQDVKLMKASGTDIIDVGLRAIANDNLSLTKQILDNNRAGRRCGSEEKVQKVLPLLFKNLQTLEVAKSSIINCQTKVMKELMGIFAEEFNTYHNGQATFNMEAFEQKVNREMQRREFVAVPVAGDQPNCVIS